MKRGKVIALISIVIGVALIAYAGYLIIPDFLSLGDYRKLALEVKRDDSETDKDNDDTEIQDESEDVVEEPSDPYAIDWETLYETAPDAKAWLSVDNTDIDFPVVQGEDNLWYLYHDVFGRESYANIFLDHRADPNGINAIIYGHTHWADTGFHQIAECDEQWRLDEIGTVRYITPEQGMLEFTPIAGLHVDPEFADVQEFEFAIDNSRLALAVESDLVEHAERGEWNMVTLEGQEPSANVHHKVLVGNKVMSDGKSEQKVSFWWVLSDDEYQAMVNAEQQSVFHAWLLNLCSKGTSHVADWEARVSSASRAIVLACCSWPYDDHRTLLVCVR